MSLILNQAQAEAVYSAMCALKKVDATLSSINLKDENGFPVVLHTMCSGMWMILSPHNASEWHDNESAFAAAYGLQTEDKLRAALETIAAGNTDPDSMVELAKEALAV